jgi:hypothetical protein
MTQDSTRIPLTQLVTDPQYQPWIEGLNRQHVALLAASDPTGGRRFSSHPAMTSVTTC